MPDAPKPGDQRRHGKSGGVAGGISQTLIDQLLRGFTAAAAAGAHLQMFLEVAELTGALVNGFDDFRVGDGCA
jgi:hypothetical protein